MTNTSNKNYDLVICSSPVDDNFQGEIYQCDSANIVEYSWDTLIEMSKGKECKYVHNGTEAELSMFVIFLNTHGIEHSFTIDIDFHTPMKRDVYLSDDDMLFLGCSHTFGTGHDDPTTVYPHFVCEKLSMNSVVGAMAGASNGYIEETLYSYPDVRQKNVIVQYTNIDRLWQNGERKHGFQYTRCESEVYTKEVVSAVFLQQVDRTVAYLRASQAKFLLLHIGPTTDKTNAMLSFYPEFVFLGDYTHDVANDGKHLGPVSNKYIAEIVAKKWKRMYVQV